MCAVSARSIFRAAPSLPLPTPPVASSSLVSREVRRVASSRRPRGGRDRPDSPLPSPRLPSLPGTQAYEAYKNQANKPPGEDGSGAEPPPEDDPDVRRYGKVGKRVWTKDAHGGAYRISTGPGARGGYDALEQLPDGRPRDVDPGYEKPATGPTTNFVGNHMTQGAIDLAQNALSRPDPDAEARLARLEAARGVHRKPPQKLPPALPPPIDPIDETDGDAPNVGSKNVGSKEDVRRVPVERYAWRDGGDRVFVTLEPRRHLPPGADLDAAEARFERDAVTLEVPVRDDDARRPGRFLPGPRARSETSDEKSALVAVAALRVRLANAIDPDRSAMTVDGGVARLELAKADPGVEWERLRREAPRREALGDAKDASRDSTDLAAVRRELIRRREGRLAERMPWLREPAPAAVAPLPCFADARRFCSS